MEHHCLHEREFGELQKDVKSLNKIMYDNGHEGLQTTVTKLSVSTKQLAENVEALRTVVSGFEKYLIGEDAKKKSRQWVTTILPSIIGVIISLTIVLWGTGIMKDAEHKMNNPQVQKIGDKYYIMGRGIVEKVDSAYFPNE
jgi:hypothetical protein